MNRILSLLKKLKELSIADIFWGLALITAISAPAVVDKMISYQNNKTLAYYHAHRESILSNIKSLTDSHSWDEAYKIASSYWKVSDGTDSDLKSLYDLAQVNSVAGIYDLKQESARVAQKEYTNAISIHGAEPTKRIFRSYYTEVKDYLEQNADDPSSLEISDCSDARLDHNSGWRTFCNFRMKNRFGALQKYGRIFYLSAGKVYYSSDQ